MRLLLPCLALLLHAACVAHRNDREVTFAFVRELPVPGGDPTAMAWSPNGGRLAVGGGAGDVVIVDPTGAEPDRELTREPVDDTVMHLCWTADGSRLAVAWRSTGLALFDVAEDRIVAMRRDLRGPVERRPGHAQLGCFTRDSHAVGVSDATLIDGWRLRVPPPGDGDLLAFAPDGDALAVTVTHVCRVLVFDLLAGGEPRESGRGEGGVLGLGWPASTTAPWWFDSGAQVLHAWGPPVRCVARRVLFQPDGSRIAVLTSDGWRLLHPDSGVAPLGEDHGCLALHSDGAAWARGSRGRIDIGRQGSVDRSRRSPLPHEYVFEGQLLDGGRIVVVNANGPHAFAVATGRPVSTAGVPGAGELVRSVSDTHLVWRRDDEITWWKLEEGVPPTAGRRMQHRFFALPELSGSARLHGRWLVCSTDAVDIRGELPPPLRPPSLGGELIPAGAAPWVVASSGAVWSLSADGTEIRQFGAPDLGDPSTGKGVTDMAVNADGSRVAIAVHDAPTQVFDIASGTRLGEVGPFHQVRLVDDDTWIGSGWSTERSEWELAIWTTAGRRLGGWRCRGRCTLLDVAPTSRRALVTEHGRAFVLSWQ